MCVIIAREPKVLIPHEKLTSAAHVNPDGFGFSIIDRGKIETIHMCETNGNNAADIIKAFDDAKDHRCYMHLRYTTAGKTNIDNCHPFQSFKGDGYEVQFMHNGTLGTFKQTASDYSDTYHFNEQIIKPTLKAFYGLYGDNVLANPTFKRILSEFKGGSVFTLYDSNGKELILGEGKKFEGWWASNDYSFNRYHREPASSYGSQGYRSKYYQGYYTGGENDEYGDYSPTDPLPASCSAVAAPTNSEPTVSEESKKVGLAIKYLKATGNNNITLTPPENRITFRELAGLGSLTDVCVLSEDELFEIVAQKPLAATALLMDLIHELWSRHRIANAAKPSQSKAVTAYNH